MGGQLDCLLQPQLPEMEGVPAYGTGEEQHITVIQTFDGLCKILRSLDGLPLAIITIQGVCPVFRFTEVFPAIPERFKTSARKQATRELPLSEKACPFYTPVLKVLCVLETSGKWPEDLEAIRRLKAAFYIKLGETLRKDHSLPVLVNTDHIDVLKTGFVFRISIGYMREITLHKTTRTPDGLVKVKDTEMSQEVEQEIVALPKLTSTLHGVHQRYNAYSGTARLAKRWLSSQLMSDYISDEAVDLIVTSLFLCSHPFTPPSSFLVGFSRFLQLLSTFNWKISPLMINLNEDFTKEDYIDIPSKFTKERSTLPLMYISTPQDKFKSHWTRKSPSAPILQRLVLLARESLQVIQTELMSGGQIDVKQIFRPPLGIYDVVLHLRCKQLSRPHQAVDCPSELNPPELDYNRENDVFPVTDFDPVQLFLAELRTIYEDFALFFYDKYGGSVIGVLWKPSAMQQKEFTVSSLKGRMPTLNEETVHLKTNTEAILEDFRIMGGGLVTRVETKR